MTGRSKNDISIIAYNQQAEKLADLYNTMSSPAVLPGLEPLLPECDGTTRMNALDIGCGTGRDAVWLAEKGFNVVAFDAAADMIRVAEDRKSHPAVQYMVDTLPHMRDVMALDREFNVMVMSAVWMHLSPEARKTTMRAMWDMAAPGALVYMSLRHGPSPDDRPMYKVSAGEVKRLAANVGFKTTILGDDTDRQGRQGVWWDYMTLRR